MCNATGHLNTDGWSLITHSCEEYIYPDVVEVLKRDDHVDSPQVIFRFPAEELETFFQEMGRKYHY